MTNTVAVVDEMVLVRVAEIVPTLLLVDVLVLVPEIVPILVPEMVPVLVPEMVPPFANTGADIARTKMPDNMIGFTFFIVVS